MSRVTMIQHINIQISNRERTREWYEKVLGAEFLDRGPELNSRQLQLRVGSGEIHTTHSPNPVPSGHFAVEIQPTFRTLTAIELNSYSILWACETPRATRCHWSMMPRA
jgi:catechol 2,3-dioxygenase-like lactoylglutathione lyase family enzyme